jgi:hypothetical protein
MEDIIFISIASVLCGADTWDEIEYFGKCKFEWLKTFLKLPEGIPSHDTFNWFFSALDPGSSNNASFNVHDQWRTSQEEKWSALMGRRCAVQRGRSAWFTWSSA